MGTVGNCVKAVCIRVQDRNLRRGEAEADAVASTTGAAFSLRDALCFPIMRCIFSLPPAVGDGIGCRTSDCFARKPLQLQDADLNIGPRTPRPQLSLIDRAGYRCIRRQFFSNRSFRFPSIVGDGVVR